MQCKDILDAPILEFLESLEGESSGSAIPADDDSVCKAFPDGDATPRKLVLAKMKSLIKNGLVSGCACGCRGDFTLTDAGRSQQKEG